jgi:transcriptional regulator with XRE-family HTH domain
MDLFSPPTSVPQIVKASNYLRGNGRAVSTMLSWVKLVRGVGRVAVAGVSLFGELLRQWRVTRHVSQLDLGMEAEVSARHISFIETGRARPSREMVLLLSSVLDVPLRERNVLLHAAGFAPVYHETGLNEPEMAEARHALQLILAQQEPYSTIVFDRLWDIVMGNAAWVRFQQILFSGRATSPAPLAIIEPPRPNLLRDLFDPAGLRPFIVNWETVAKVVLARLHRQVVWDRDDRARSLLKEMLAYPEIPARWREGAFDASGPAMIIPIEMRIGDQPLRLFSTLTTLGSPQDITLQEVHIETFHPADDQSERFIRHLASQSR